MANTNILLDTNILMELFFERAKREVTIRTISTLPKDSVFSITILSLSTLLYYVEKENIDKSIVHAFLESYKVLDMSSDDYAWVRENDEGDFEDGLQAGCALRHHCKSILTLDQSFEKMYGKYISVQTVR